MLEGTAFALLGRGCASEYAKKLLCSLGSAAALGEVEDVHPAIRWQQSGMMALTGQPLNSAEPPLGQMCPVPIASCADGTLAALWQLADHDPVPRGAELLSERAGLFGYTRQGPIAPGGSCQLIQSADRVLAVNLARDEDWDLIPAWLESDSPVIRDDWAQLSTLVSTRNADYLVSRGRELGLPVAIADPLDLLNGSVAGRPWFQVFVEADKRPQDDVGPCKPPKVVDLSSLWAGPLCTQLLQQLGAEVVKVESQQRPDGARRGNAEFWQQLNEGKQELSLDFSDPADIQQLRDLLASADIVIEASRPRALRQLGIVAEEFVQDSGVTWISISGYGRNEPEANWVAFGDDAAVAAGLSQLMYVATGQWMFCGDAIADPLTGMHAALVAWSSYVTGGGRLIAVPMSDVVAHCIAHDLPASQEAIRQRQCDWTALALSA